MNLREGRDALADSSIPLSSSLLKAKVLTSLLRAKELREYVDRELHGYAESETVPPYRHLPIDSLGTFINPPRFKPVENHPVPTTDLPEQLQSWARMYVCADSIGAIEKLIDTADENMIWMPWPHENVAVIPTVDIGGYGFRCSDAFRCFSTERLQGVLDNVRNTVLDIVLDLTEQFPEQQESEQQLSSLPTTQVQTIINNHITGDYATIASGGVVQQSVAVHARDIASLIDSLTKIGLPAGEQEALRAAIEEDARAEGDGKLGPRVRAWLGDLASKAVDKSLETGLVVALPHVIDAISKFFG